MKERMLFYKLLKKWECYTKGYETIEELTKDVALIVFDVMREHDREEELRQMGFDEITTMIDEYTRGE